jgi:hypothetical protein
MFGISSYGTQDQIGSLPFTLAKAVSQGMRTSLDPQAIALLILENFGQARTGLSGAAVVLSNGTAGTIERIFLDELHGLRIALIGHEGQWPISTVKLLVQVERPALRRPSGLPAWLSDGLARRLILLNGFGCDWLRQECG